MRSHVIRASRICHHIYRRLLRKDIHLINNLDIVGIKESDSFASDIKKAKRKRGDIFIIRLHQTMILYIKPDIKMRYLNLF